MTSTRKKFEDANREVARGKLDQSNVSKANGCLRLSLLLLEVEEDEDEAVAAGVGIGAGAYRGKVPASAGGRGMVDPITGTPISSTSAM